MQLFISRVVSSTCTITTSSPCTHHPLTWLVPLLLAMARLFSAFSTSVATLLTAREYTIEYNIVPSYHPITPVLGALYVHTRLLVCTDWFWFHTPCMQEHEGIAPQFKIIYCLIKLILTRAYIARVWRAETPQKLKRNPVFPRKFIPSKYPHYTVHAHLFWGCLNHTEHCSEVWTLGVYLWEHVFVPGETIRTSLTSSSILGPS